MIDSSLVSGRYRSDVTRAVHFEVGAAAAIRDLPLAWQAGLGKPQLISQRMPILQFI
jgi:hypothetical protein